MLMPPADLLRRYRPTRYVPSAPYVKRFPRNTYNANTLDDLANADIAYTNYSVPNGFTPYYLDAVSGNDANNGTSSGTAWKTWNKGIASTPNLGCLIILTSGTYYANIGVAGTFVPATSTRVIYVQPAAGVKAWVDGRDDTTVQTTGWTNLGGGRWSIAGWGTTVPNTYRWMYDATIPLGDSVNGGFYNDATYQQQVDTTNGRYAAYPDLVTYNDRVLKWAANAAGVVSGTFFLDYVGGTMTMTVGDDPTVAGKLRCGKSPCIFAPQSASVIRGIGFRCAPTHQSSGAMVHANLTSADDMQVENCTFVYARAGHGFRTTTTVDRYRFELNTCAYNGSCGFASGGSTTPTIRYNALVYNNWNRQANGTGRFKVWDSGGLKMVQAINPTITDNYVSYNGTIGLWLDISCVDPTLVRNECAYNSNPTVAALEAHGIFLEESARGYVLDNICYGNDGTGIRNTESNDAYDAHNTCYDNAVDAISWRENAQSDTPSGTAQTYGVTMNTTNGRMVNNILSRPTGSHPDNAYGLLHVENVRSPVPAGTGASAMLPGCDFNLYARAVVRAAVNVNAVRWKDDGASAVTSYGSLAGWQAAVGSQYDAHGSEADNGYVLHPYLVAPEMQDFRIISSSRATTLRGVTLPPTACNRLSIPKGSVPDIGSFHRGRSARLAYLGRDTFNRAAAAASWGTADLGGAWTLSGTAADFTTDGFVGKMALTAASTTREAYLTTTAPRDGTSQVRIKTDKLAVGGNLHAYLVLRQSATANYEYRARLRFATNGQMFVAATKLEGSATESVVGAESSAVAGLTHAIETYYWLKADISGTTTTTINIKVWQDGTAEPSAWTATITDSTPHANLQVAGMAGLAAATAVGVSNVPVTVSFDELDVWCTPSYLFRDSFSTAASAPLGTFAASETGTWTSSDDENKASKSGGELVLLKRSSQNGGPALWTPSQARAVGRAIFGRYRTNDTVGLGSCGWDTNAALFLNGLGIIFAPATSEIRVQANATTANNCGTSAQLTDIEWCAVMLTTGGVLLARNAGTAAWTVLYVETTVTGAMFGSVTNQTATQVQFDDVRIVDLAPLDMRFAADTALCTDRKATSAAGDTITTPADCLVHHTFVAATGVTKNIFVRRTDDNNAIIVRCDQTNSTIAIISKAAGVETVLNSVAQTWTNATTYTVKITAEAATVATYVGDTLKARATNATFNQTTTGAKVDHVGSEFKSFPRTLTLGGF